MKPKTLRAIHANVEAEVAYLKTLRGSFHEVYGEVMSSVVAR